MPKVTTKYLTDRKDFILECTNEVLKEKPLYQITMRDIIKKAQNKFYHLQFLAIPKRMFLLH